MWSIKALVLFAFYTISIEKSVHKRSHYFLNQQFDQEITFLSKTEIITKREGKGESTCVNETKFLQFLISKIVFPALKLEIPFCI